MKKIFSVIASPWIMTVCLLLFAIAMAAATFFEGKYGTDAARHFFYNAKWFEAIIVIGAINLLTSIFTRKLYRREKFSIFLFHLSFIVIIIGAGITRYFGFEGMMQIREGESSNVIILPHGGHKVLPFTLYLTDFIIDYYPGSHNPSGYESKVLLIDNEQKIREEHRIYMNNILIHRGYRFYQSSYTKNKDGTILSVNKNAAGTAVTYIGYFLLALGMAWSLLNKNSRFAKLVSGKIAVAALILTGFAVNSNAQENDKLPVIPREHAKLFGSILVRDFQGRTKPVSTMASDIFRKVARKTSYKGQDADQIMLGMLVFPEKWEDENIVYAGSLAEDALSLKSSRVAIADCYMGMGLFNSSKKAYEANQEQPATRSKTDNAVIRFDERLNILFQWLMGNMLHIYPIPTDSSGKWYTPVSVHGKVSTVDTVFVNNVFTMYLGEVKKSVSTGDWSVPDKLVDAIKKYQAKYGSFLPSGRKVELEQWYYQSNIFNYIFYFYFFFGFILLLLQLGNIFSGKTRFKLPGNIIVTAIAIAFFVHTCGLAVRWYISGHAPWSNAYESMLFISWAAMFAGMTLAKKSTITAAIAAIMSSIFLMTANMSWMDPQITNLVPVLKSTWLVIHVAVITSSYGFLGVGAILALVNLITMALQTGKNYMNTVKSIKQMSRLTEISLTVGLYLLVIGTFLGGIWANVSWGNYWSWDSKETWALITVIIYAFVLHLRLIPALKGAVLFNSLALLAYGSVMMTYFGVNFYLKGMHSYATGDPAPIPMGVYYTIAILVIIITAATVKYRKFSRVDG